MYFKTKKWIVSGLARLNVGLALVVVLSLAFAVVAQAQTDSDESGSNSEPTLTIASSHATVTKGEEVTFTLTADAAPTSDLELNVQITVQGPSVNETATVALPLATGQEIIELIIDTGGGSAVTGGVTLGVSVFAGSGYQVGNPGAASVRVLEPPAEQAARDSNGKATPTPGVRQIIPPPAPSGFSASAVDHDSINVSWDYLDGASHYRLEEDQSVPPVVVLWVVVSGHSNITGTSDTVDGLVSRTTYTYRVRAYGDGFYYSEEWGSPSSGDSATTLALPTPVPTAEPTAEPTPTPTPEAPPAPDNFQLSAAPENDSGQVTITFTWDSRTGVVKYRYRLAGSSTFTPLENVTTTTYTGVCKTTYTFLLSGKGDGNTYSTDFGAEASQKVTTGGCPKIPKPQSVSTGSVGRYSMTVSWSRPAVAGVAVDVSAIGGFRLEQSENGGTYTLVSNSIGASATSHPVSGLKCGTPYRFRLAARGTGSPYSTDDSAWEYSSSRNTSECPQIGAPRNIDTTNIKRNSITVTWDRPSGISALQTNRIGNYKLDKKKGSGGWTLVSATISGSATSHPVGSLDCNTSYSFRIYAKGTGHPYSTAYSDVEATDSSTRTSTCPEIGPPRNLEKQSATDKSITVMWDPPSGASDSEIGGYEVGLSGSTWTKTVESGTESATVPNLMCGGRSYTIWVRAKGTGSPYSTAYGSQDSDSFNTGDCPLDIAPTPTNVQVAAPTAANSLTVSWGQADGAPGIAKYKLERRLEPDDGSGWIDVVPTTEGIKPGSGTSTSFTDSSLECNTAYRFRVSAYGDNMTYAQTYSDPAPSADGVPGATKLCAPNFSIVPLPQRMVRLQWQTVTDADGYVVQIQKTGQDWGRTATPTPETRNLGENETHYDIDLMDIYEGEGLAHDTDGFEFRVMAIHSNSNRNSAYSADIIVRDSPIIRVNGHSPGGDTDPGKAIVTWKPPGDAIEYYVRWRKLSSGDHTADTWQLNDNSFSATTFDGASMPSSVTAHDPDTMEHTINGLERGALYAIQLNYQTNDGWVFSGRDAYVWPSGSQPGPGKRVAGYPFAGYFPSKTYAYMICEHTFTSNFSDWEDLIDHALGQWQTATGGFIKTKRLADDCPVYFKNNMPTPYQEWLALISNDASKSEIRWVTPPDDPTKLEGSLYEMITGDVTKACILHKGFLACTAAGSAFAPAFQDPPEALDPSDDLVSSDILLNSNEIELPSTPIPTSVAFNACVRNGMPIDQEDSADNYQAYAGIIHEGGHALGLTGFGRSATFQLVYLTLFGIAVPADTEAEVYHASHPHTTTVVMNYDGQMGRPSEPDCAPHPLDVLAIMALYQSAPTPTP